MFDKVLSVECLLFCFFSVKFYHETEIVHYKNCAKLSFVRCYFTYKCTCAFDVLHIYQLAENFLDKLVNITLKLIFIWNQQRKEKKIAFLFYTASFVFALNDYISWFETCLSYKATCNWIGAGMGSSQSTLMTRRPRVVACVTSARRQMWSGSGWMSSKEASWAGRRGRITRDGHTSRRNSLTCMMMRCMVVGSTGEMCESHFLCFGP